MSFDVIYYGEHLWVYGGKGNHGNFNDLSVFSFNLKNWLTVPQPTGSSPAQRRSHKCVLVQNKMIVFGGYIATKCMSDMFEYNFGK
jgi:hypothetical protein